MYLDVDHPQKQVSDRDPFANQYYIVSDTKCSTKIKEAKQQSWEFNPNFKIYELNSNTQLRSRKRTYKMEINFLSMSF